MITLYGTIILNQFSFVKLDVHNALKPKRRSLKIVFLENGSSIAGASARRLKFCNFVVVPNQRQRISFGHNHSRFAYE